LFCCAKHDDWLFEMEADALPVVDEALLEVEVDEELGAESVFKPLLMNVLRDIFELVVLKRRLQEDDVMRV